MGYTMSRVAQFVLSAATLMLAASCSLDLPRISGPSDAAMPADSGLGVERPSLHPGSQGWFPLGVGNRWTYLRRFDHAMLLDGSSRPAATTEYRSTLTGIMVCSERHEGRDYVVERRTVTDGVQSSHYWIRHRQDAAGLYEWDSIGPAECDVAAGLAVAGSVRQPEAPGWTEVATRLGVPQDSRPWRAAWDRLEAKRALIHGLGAANRLARGVEPGEIQRLSYPLRPRQAWIIRDDPRFTSRVEGGESLRTPAGVFPAWRIRIESELFGSGDVVRTWYGRAGYLGLHATFSAVVTDENGRPIATLTSEQSETLIELQLAKHTPAASMP